MSSDHARLMRDLKKQGFAIETTGRGRLRVTRNGGPPVIVPARRDKGRTLKNCVQALRKIGYER